MIYKQFLIVQKMNDFTLPFKLSREVLVKWLLIHRVIHSLWGELTKPL